MNDSSNIAGDFIRDLGNSARQNPVSAALLGMGVLWLFAGGARRAGFDGFAAAGDAMAAGRSAVRSGLQTVGNGASNFTNAVGDRVDRVSQSASEAIHSAANTMSEGGSAAYGRTSRLGSELSDTALDFARSIPGSASDVFDTARSHVAVLLRDQPLLLGAVGLVIGAGIAASLPPTEFEAEYFGETSAQLKENAEQFVLDQAARAKTVADDVVTAATDAARRQGLTADALKAAAVDLGAKVKTVVGAGADSIKGQVSYTPAGHARGVRDENL